MQKRGQLQLSFGMIFSIILIIVTVAVAFYIITRFLDTGECLKIQLFYDDLEKEVDNVWRSPLAEKIFRSGLSGKVESVCFGSPQLLSISNYSNEQRVLQRYSEFDYNVFMYPTLRACDSNLGFHKLEHASIPKSFCVKTKEGEVSLRLIKERSSDNLVTLKP
ncbi:hypothetical protein J4461_00745 [Candidatus Pacearchaeota archaeon]|nr:hypothetical protein [Candidatus Pacearchaeota archaeon]